MILARVVLPDPDSPTIAKQSFSSIIKLMSCNALTIVFLIKNFFYFFHDKILFNLYFNNL